MARRRRQERFHEKHAWVLLFALSLFIAATAVVGIVSGIDRTDFEQSTNLTWDEMLALNPTVSDYVQRVIMAQRRSLPWPWPDCGLTLLDRLSQGGTVRLVRHVGTAAGAGSERGGFRRGSLRSGVLLRGYTLIAVVGLLLPYRKFFPNGANK